MCDWPHNGTFWKANHTGAASFCGGVPMSLRWQTKVTSLPSPPTTISRIIKERNSHLLTVTQSFFRDGQIKQCGRYGMRKSEKKKNELLRQWLLPQAAERLKEEGFNQSVNRFSEDYKLTRNPSLFGIPGAWEAEELQLLLEEAKENSALQVIDHLLLCWFQVNWSLAFAACTISRATGYIIPAANLICLSALCT